MKNYNRAKINIDEKALVTKAKKGDRESIEEILRSQESVLRSTVLYMLAGSNDCDDVVQEARLALYKAISRFEFQSALSTFVTRIALNVSIDKIRMSRRQKLLYVGDCYDIESTCNVDQGLCTNDDYEYFSWENKRTIIHNALSSLNTDQRSVLSLRYIQGFSTEETARILGVKIGTVLSRLDRAKKNFRSNVMLDERGAST